MSHTEQMDFVSRIKSQFPENFKSKRVLEVGSYNVNGTVRVLFENCEYVGIDICEGECVDVVCSGHLYKSKKLFDTVITCEMLEHNFYWKETLVNIIPLLKKGGLFVMTCATTGRGTHGTTSISPVSSLSHLQYGEYYKNITEEDIRSVLDIEDIFSQYKFETNTKTHDLYLYGIKK